MPPDPGEPNEKITLNVFARDMALLRQRYPRGGHLVFIKRLLRAWAESERKGWDDINAAIDKKTDEAPTLERKFP